MYEAVATRPGVAQDVVELRSVVLGPREQGMVRLRMLASTINPSDLVTISGAYRSRTVFPFVGGFEGVGQVVEADADSALAVGTRVILIRRAGCWAQLRDVPEHDCIPVPQNLSTEQACFAFINPMTTYALVTRYATDTGPIIVTAAASEAATQIAALLASRNVPVIGMVRNSSRMPDQQELWTEVISTDLPGWQQKLYRLTGQSASVVFDAVGGPEAHLVAQALKPGGVFVSYGLLSGIPIHVPLGFPSHVQLKYFHLRQDVHHLNPTHLAQQFQEVFSLVASGHLATRPAARYPLTQIREALVWNAENRGKVLLEIHSENPG